MVQLPFVLCFLIALPEAVGAGTHLECNFDPSGQRICSNSDQTALLQGRVHLSLENNESAATQASSHRMDVSDHTKADDDLAQDDVDLAQVQVRRAPLMPSWSLLHHQQPEVIHYPAVGYGTKEVVRVCFVLVNTLHDAKARFGRHRKFRATWEYPFPTPTELGDLYFKHKDSAASFINAASYGKVAVSGTVVGWYNDTRHDDFSASEMFHHRERYFRLARGAVNLDDYDVFTLVGLAPKGVMQKGWDRSNNILDPDCEGSYSRCTLARDVGMIFLINAGMYKKTRLEGNPYTYAGVLPSKSWPHELAHALGSLGHDNALMCGKSPISDRCQQVNYANQFSVMGKSNWAQSPSCQSMEQLGWLRDDEVETVTLGEEAKNFTLTPRSITGGGLKCLKVNLPAPFGGISSYPKPFGVLWIDHRQASGFDTALGWLDKSVPLSWGGLQRWTGAESAIRNDGVLLTLAPATHDASRSSRRRKFPWAKSELIDVHADSPYRDDLGRISACRGKFADAALLAGETLRCEQLGFEVQVMNVDAKGAAVRLHRNPNMEGCPAPKSLSMTAHGDLGGSNENSTHSGDAQAPMVPAAALVQDASMIIDDEAITSPSQCHIVKVEVKPDKWMAEPSWTIDDPNGHTWISGKGPESLNAQTECAPMPGEYMFIIRDAHGDGICCQHGNGSYEVKVGQTIVASGGDFGWSEKALFRIV